MALIEPEINKLESDITNLSRVKQEKLEEKANLEQRKTTLKEDILKAQKKYEREIKEETGKLERVLNTTERDLKKVTDEIKDLDSEVQRLTRELESLRQK